MLKRIVLACIVTLLTLSIADALPVTPTTVPEADFPLKVTRCEYLGETLNANVAPSSLAYTEGSVRFHFVNKNGNLIGDQIVEAPVGGWLAEQSLLFGDLAGDLNAKNLHCFVDRASLARPEDGEAAIYSSSAVLQACKEPSNVVVDGGPDASMTSIFVGVDQVAIRLNAFRNTFFAQPTVGLDNELYGVRLDNGIVAETSVTASRTTDVVFRLRPLSRGLHRIDYGPFDFLSERQGSFHVCFRVGSPK